MSQTSDFRSFELMNLNKDYHFFLQNGLFISCLNENKSIGFLVIEKDFAPIKLKSVLKDCIIFLGNKPAQIKIKIIGSQSLISKWLAHFPADIQSQQVIREGDLEIIFSPFESRTRVAQASLGSNELTLPTKTSSISQSNSQAHSSASSNSRILPQSQFNPNLNTKSASQNIVPNHSNKAKFENNNSSRHPNPIKVLIVDDSKTIRTLLRGILSKSSSIQVVADTGSPLEVISLIEKFNPDVITLDIHMPEKDGVTLLKEYIKIHPIPTIMISSISMEEGPYVLNALESGAVDYIQKPQHNELAEAAELMIEKIKAASTARIANAKSGIKRTSKKSNSNISVNTLIAIGSSTGGTEAIKDLFAGLPDQIPPIVIVQHIPPVFSKAFADRLNSLFPFEVKEAEHGDLILPNRVLIAPGGKQMKVVKVSQKLQISIEDTPPVNRHKPSVDVLFDSLIESKVNKGIAVILTGMGSDGAKGMSRLFEKGWLTIAQDKESCVVFGMPAVAIQLGAAQHVCSIHDIPNKIQELLVQLPAA